MVAARERRERQGPIWVSTTAHRLDRSVSGLSEIALEAKGRDAPPSRTDRRRAEARLPPPGGWFPVEPGLERRPPPGQAARAAQRGARSS